MTTTTANPPSLVPGPGRGTAQRSGPRTGQRFGSPADLVPLLRRLTGDEKHGPSAHSTLDVLWVLYDRILRISPETVDDPGRDRFLLSKGHGPAAYYAVLAAKGFIPEHWLDDLAG